MMGFFSACDGTLLAEGKWWHVLLLASTLASWQDTENGEGRMRKGMGRLFRSWGVISERNDGSVPRGPTGGLLRSLPQPGLLAPLWKGSEPALALVTGSPMRVAVAKGRLQACLGRQHQPPAVILYRGQLYRLNPTISMDSQEVPC